MKLTVFVAGGCLALVTVASAQTYTTTQTTKAVTIQGDVVRYEPGRTIVIRGADAKEITYTLPLAPIPPFFFSHDGQELRPAQHVLVELYGRQLSGVFQAASMTGAAACATASASCER